MSDIDLTAAKAAAHKMTRDNLPVDFMGDKRMEDWAALLTHYAVTAAAPLIEAAVRESIAAEIADRKRFIEGPDSDVAEHFRSAMGAGLWKAECIARGES